MRIPQTEERISVLKHIEIFETGRLITAYSSNIFLKKLYGYSHQILICTPA